MVVVFCLLQAERDGGVDEVEGALLGGCGGGDLVEGGLAEGDGVAGEGGHVREQAAEAVQWGAGVVGAPGGFAFCAV